MTMNTTININMTYLIAIGPILNTAINPTINTTISGMAVTLTLLRPENARMEDGIGKEQEERWHEEGGLGEQQDTGRSKWVQTKDFFNLYMLGTQHYTRLHRSTQSIALHRIRQP